MHKPILLAAICGLSVTPLLAQSNDNLPPRTASAPTSSALISRSRLSPKVEHSAPYYPPKVNPQNECFDDGPENDPDVDTETIEPPVIELQPHPADPSLREGVSRDNASPFGLVSSSRTLPSGSYCPPPEDHRPQQPQGRVDRVKAYTKTTLGRIRNSTRTLIDRLPFVKGKK